MIQIITDSTADLLNSMLAVHPIEIVPLHVIIDGNTYADGIELTKEQFYGQLRASKELPTTSQPSPAHLRERFQRVLDRGHDVYYVGVASTLSGTIQAAKIARTMVSEPERVTIFDSLTVAFAQGMLAFEAANLASAGHTAEEITTALTELRARQKVVINLATLENVRRSGRINNLSYLFGSLLSIKPILMIDEAGVVQVYEKVRGAKNANAAMLRFLQEYPVDERYALGIGHTCEPNRAETVRLQLDTIGIRHTMPFEISGVIGTHAGLGAIGLIYFARA